ncbi:MAG: hypothetical protein JO051_14485 [Acidobacteriaceae bacterium]|nr:hypothetical protein [Acidobacteriaceae bacterium]
MNVSLMENGNPPATKQDIERLVQGLAQLRSEMNHMCNDLVERMSDRETRLLNAFYGFVESNVNIPPAA